METVEIKKTRGLDGGALKVIAMVTMFMDHYAHVYVGMGESAYLILRGIGRLAFPIYCFLLVEGFNHTWNYPRYLIRMAAFALLSEIPFDLAIFGWAFYPYYQNVMFTLLIGLAGLGAYRWCVNRKMPIYGILVMIASVVMGWVVKCDYGAEGVLLIFFMYLFQNYPVRRAIALGIWCVMMGSLELFGVFAVLPLAFYNGKRGNSGKGFKYFGYFFYPAHLFILWLGTTLG